MNKSFKKETSDLNQGFSLPKIMILDKLKIIIMGVLTLILFPSWFPILS